MLPSHSDLSLGPLALPGHWAFSLEGRGPQRWEGQRARRALCLAPWAEFQGGLGQRGLCHDSGTDAKPGIPVCSFSAVPKLMANPRKPVKGRGGGLSSSNSKNL